MNRAIAQKFDRLKLYLERIRKDLRDCDPVQGMADAAELAEIARRLYEDFSAIIKGNVSGI
jgi:hypothetical protein